MSPIPTTNGNSKWSQGFSRFLCDRLKPRLQILERGPRPLVSAIVIVGALALLLVADRLMVRLNGDMINADFFSFRLSGCGLREGVSNYDPAAWADLHVRYGRAWIENPILTYPLPVSFIFLPFCMLPLPLAATAWELVSQVMLILSITALFIGLRAGRPPLAFLVPVVFLSRPAIAVFTNGQLAALWPFSLSLFYLLARRGRYAAAGSVLTLLLLKPSLPVIILPVALAWLLKRRAWKGLLAFVMVSAAALSLSLLVQPEWIEQWWHFSSLRGTEFGTFVPTLWGLLYDLLAAHLPPLIWLGAGAIMAALLIVFCIWWFARIWDPWPPAVWLASAVCVSLFVSPYAWNYDHVLLIFPLGVILALSNHMAETRRRLTWGGAVVVMDVLPYVLLVVAGWRQVDTLSALVPLAMLLLLTAAVYWSRHEQGQISSIAPIAFELTREDQ